MGLADSGFYPERESSFFPPVPAAKNPLHSVSVDDRNSTKVGGMLKTTEEMLDRIDYLENRNAELLEVIRAQGEFIMSLKHQIRDFMGNA